MKIFFRNLFNEFRRNPIYPLAIIVTLIYASCVLATSIVMKDVSQNDSLLKEKEMFGEADLSLKTNDSFFLIDDLEKILADRAEVYGYFYAPFRINGGEMVDCLVTDIAALQEFNPIKVTEQLHIANANLDDVAIVAEDFAADHSLNLGDTVSTIFLGKKLSFVVGAIASSSHSVTIKYDVVFNMRGIVKYLLKEFRIYLGEETSMCTEALIRITDGSSPKEIKDLIHNTYGNGYNVSIVNKTKTKTDNKLTFMIPYLFAIIAVVSSVVTIHSFFSSFIDKRLKTLSLFRSIGYSANRINALILSEGAFYAVVGGVIGIFIANFTKLYAAKEFLTKSVPQFTFAAMSVALLLTIATALVTLVAPLIRLRKTNVSEMPSEKFAENKKSGFLFPVTCAVLLVVVFVLLRTLNYKNYFFVAMIGLAVVIFLLYSIVSPVFSSVAIGYAKIRRGFRKVGVSIALSRQMSADAPLKSATRMLSVSMLIIFSMIAILSGVKNQINDSLALFEFENLVLDYSGEIDKTTEYISGLDGVETAKSGYLKFAGTTAYVGDNVLAIDYDLGELIDSETFSYEKKGALKGNEAIVTTGTAEIYKLKTGDTATFTISDKKYNLKISQIIDLPIPLIVVCPELIGVKPNTIFVKTDADTEVDVTETLLENISQRFCYVITKEYFFSNESVNIVIRLGKFFTVLVGAFVALGVINTYAECFRKKKNEYNLLSTLGCDRKTLALFSLAEILYSVFIALLCASILAIIVIRIIYYAGLTIGIALSFF